MQNSARNEHLPVANDLHLRLLLGLLVVAASLQSIFLLLCFLNAAPCLGRTDPCPLICSFSVLESFCHKILNDNSLTHSLVPRNGELHHYQLSAQDVVRLNQSKLVIGFSPDSEAWLEDWEKSSPGRHVIWLAHKGKERVVPAHGWTDPKLVKAMMKRLKDEMVAAKIPVQIDDKQLVEEVDAVDEELSKLFMMIPAGKRAIISQHPNLEPFAERYGLKVVGTLLASPSAEAADTSARHYSSLLKSIRTNDVRAVFVDEGQNLDLALRLTQDAGLPPPVALNIESLSGPEGQARSWKEMMLRNGRLIHGALMR